jgi:hypothetical protein
MPGARHHQPVQESQKTRLYQSVATNHGLANLAGLNRHVFTTIDMAASVPTYGRAIGAGGEEIRGAEGIARVNGVLGYRWRRRTTEASRRRWVPGGRHTCSPPASRSGAPSLGPPIPIRARVGEARRHYRSFAGRRRCGHL